MRHFTKLIQELEIATNESRKIEALIRYFTVADDPSKVWTISILSGNRPSRIVKMETLRKWVSAYSTLPKWLFDHNCQVVGDQAEAISLLLPEPKKSKNHTLDYWIRLLIVLKKSDAATIKERVTKAWNLLNRNERYIFNKLISGGFRIKVAQKVFTKSLSIHTGIDEDSLAYKLLGQWDPSDTTFQSLVRIDQHLADKAKPFPFYQTSVLDKPIHQLGHIADWQIERRWKGIRVLLIFRNNQIFIWSKEELITNKFPELYPLVDRIPEGTVIEGELICFKGGLLLSFDQLKKRLNSKKISKKLLREAPVLFIAFDLLEFNGKDIRSLSLQKRYSILQDNLNNKDPDKLKISEILDPSSWLEVSIIHKESRAHRSEGLMLRHKKSSYHIDGSNGDWWKWKAEPFTVDAVLVYAASAQGGRLFSEFTFAVWNNEILVPVTKTQLELSVNEMREINEYVKDNTVERFGPVRSIKPNLVFEIAFDDIHKSKRHKSGIVLKVPRVIKWKKDKSIAKVVQLEELVNLARKYERRN